ncbi:ATP/GTP-binding protein [Chitinophaga sp. sic0106]|uniref:AAA family ATPase n=1 Tax=Chitinophaga sp. sic0106 TaxID=2854785 RepID=UPI001C47E1F3|nr:AAA family ATPase [Chitinophaga sp. sic0106]MBV7530887.1 AAA family ATPase [Chitinophaga sp. sic0106]
MEANFIEYLHISDFKSIQQLDLIGFKRINLFIGRPNVGKSNIIEALSLYSIPYLKENSSKKLSNLVRVEHESELFYNGNPMRDAVIKSNVGLCTLIYNPKEGLNIRISKAPFDDAVFSVDAKLMVKANKKNNTYTSPVKRYTYNSDVVYKKGHAKYLIPPFGPNLFSIIEQDPSLREEVKGLFAANNLEIVFDKGSQTIKVIQHKVDDDIFLIPYNSIADTLQRIIFYKTAISSNNNSILLFEEPEAHSFPPYMTHFTQEIIHKRDNQYMIATHSPFILNDLLENAREELAVFIVDYKNRATTVRQLSDKELHDIFQIGVDLFTNSESYI